MVKAAGTWASCHTAAVHTTANMPTELPRPQAFEGLVGVEHDAVTQPDASLQSNLDAAVVVVVVVVSVVVVVVLVTVIVAFVVAIVVFAFLVYHLLLRFLFPSLAAATRRPQRP